MNYKIWEEGEGCFSFLEEAFGDLAYVLLNADKKYPGKNLKVQWGDLAIEFRASTSATPPWRVVEGLAEAVNRSPAVNGVEIWMCEQCGRTWKEKAPADYDRTKDGSNWPVICCTVRADAVR